MAKKITKSKKRILRPSVIVIAIIVAVGIVITLLEVTNTTHIFHKKPQSKVVVTVGKPVAPAAKSSVNSASTESTAKTPTSNNSEPGGATDNNGSNVPSTPSNQWATSATGYITVKSPLANSTLKDGDVLAGSAEVSQVSYSLIDNSVGVISQGQLNVVNGNFSGALHFQPQGTGGRLDVFSTNSQGVEYNEVQVNVSF
jgi:cytoskeletal protein RodZ